MQVEKEVIFMGALQKKCQVNRPFFSQWDTAAAHGSEHITGNRKGRETRGKGGMAVYSETNIYWNIALRVLLGQLAYRATALISLGLQIISQTCFPSFSFCVKLLYLVGLELFIDLWNKNPQTYYHCIFRRKRLKFELEWDWSIVVFWLENQLGSSWPAARFKCVHKG